MSDYAYGGAYVESSFDDLSEFESLLDDARMNAENDWAEGFVADILARYKKYKGRTAWSPTQHRNLLRIAGVDE